MQNVQNVAEIQQRVINLVELYRTKVGKESKIAKEAKQVHDEWLRTYCDYSDLIGKETDEDWFRLLMVNEQLLGHFYSVIAGENADRLILNELFPEQYTESVFTEEEELFLRNHFKEMVNYIIQTPCNDIQYLGRHDGKDALTIPCEVIELIKSRVDIPFGSKVYNPFAGYGQFAIAYPESHFYCDDRLLFLDEENDEVKDDKYIHKWPSVWLKLALLANKVDAEVVHSQIKEYDAVISYLYLIPNDDNIIGDRITEEFIDAYTHLRNGGKMILICPNSLCWGRDNFPNLEYGKMPRKELLVGWWRKIQHEFRHAIISDGSLLEIIQLPQVMSSNTMRNDYSILIIEKGRCVSETTMIDARFASKKSDRKNFRNIFDVKAFDAMLKNQGCDAETGLRKLVKVPATDIHEDLLIPQTYVVEKPSENEKPVPLSSLCLLVTDRVKDVKTDLPLDTPLVTAKNLSSTFNGALDMKTVDNANCPNNPPHTKEYTFDKNGNFVDDPNHYIFGEGTEKDLQVAEYRQSIFLDGSKDAVLMALSKDVPKMVLYQSTGNPIAIETHPVLGNKCFHVICPKDGVDAMHLFAILRNPIVYRQLQAYEEFGLYGEKGYLKDILVPTDKRLIFDELSRMHREKTALTELNNNYLAAQKKHTTKLEDYQHAMRKHIREISSSVRRMERFVNEMESSEEIKIFLHERLEVIKTHRLYLSEDIERLNEENTYGKAVPLDIDHCLKGFKDYFGTDTYPIVYSNEVAKEALKQYVESHRKELHDMNEADRSKIFDRIKEEKSFAYVDIAEYNFGKVIRNILENARIHGFSTDISRNDYKIEIVLTWNSEREMYQIDFRNNGAPLPDGLSKESYGENRKYAGKTGGTGIGGYEVADTVKHYKGDYAISQDGDWVVVSVYLPKSKSYEEGV